MRIFSDIDGKSPQNTVEDLYPTRIEKEAIIDRHDPVLYGGSPQENALSNEELGFYEKNGFLLFPDFFSEEETNQLLSEYGVLLASQDDIEKSELIFEPESPEIRSIFNPHKYSGLFERLMRDSRILDKVEQILGSRAYLHHSRINVKKEGGKSFPWHSDFETWHAEDGIPRMRALTAWVMLTENNEFNGPLYLIPGSHKKFVCCRGYTPKENFKESLRKQSYGTPSFDAIRKLVKDSRFIGAYGKPGTLVFHESNIMHASPDNISPWPRTNLYYVYNSIDNRPAKHPYGAKTFRPDFLSNPEILPLERS